MTILYDSIPGRFEDVAERQRLKDQQHNAYWRSFTERQQAGIEDRWVLKLGPPRGNGGTVRSARLVRSSRD